MVIALVSAAVAGTLGEPWADGVTTRAPRPGGFAVVDATWVPVAPQAGFGAVTAGGAGHLYDEVVGGAVVTASGFHAELLEGPGTDLQTVGLELWLVVEQVGWRHGFSIGAHDPLGAPSGWYLRNPIEGSRRLATRYVAWWDGDRVDLTLQSQAAAGATYALDLGLAAACAVELRPWLAATGALEGRLGPLGTARVGLQARPSSFAELGATLAWSFPLFSPIARSELQPGVLAKVWR